MTMEANLFERLTDTTERGPQVLALGRLGEGRGRWLLARGDIGEDVALLKRKCREEVLCCLVVCAQVQAWQSEQTNG